MTKPPKRRRSRKGRPDFFANYRFWLTLLSLAAFTVAGLVLFTLLKEEPPPAIVPAVVPPVVADEVLRAEVEDFLAKTRPTSGLVRRELDRRPPRYTVVGESPSEELLENLRARLAALPGRFLVTLTEDGVLSVVSAGREVVVVRFVTPVPEKPVPVIEMPSGPMVAIIMDDLGRSLQQARTLLSFPQKVTFAILPDEEHAGKIAELGHAAGREIMLHVPMEPQGYPAVNPGSEALFVQYDDAEIRRRFDLLLARIPHATGVNNHMGSRFTEDARALAPVMESLKEKGLFFVDSLTTGRSKVALVANLQGVPTIERDVFLDNVADVTAIGREIRRLEDRARRQGMAVGICHPYPETLEALRRELPGLTARGVRVVPVSVLLHKQALSQGS